MKTKKYDPVIRAFLLTIIDTFNSPIFSSCSEFAKVFDPIYYCATEEFSNSGVRHMHVYILCKSPIRLSVVKKCLPKWIHVNVANGAPQNNIDYLRKTGDFEGFCKEEFFVKSFREYGKLPKNTTDKSSSNHKKNGVMKSGNS